MPRKKITVALSDQFLQMIDLALDTGGRIDLKSLAADYGVSPAVMRRALVEHYGDTIAFKKKVGIVRANPTPVLDTVESA
jgi:hypothetical protein